MSMLSNLKDPNGPLVMPALDIDFSVVADRVAGHVLFTQAVQSVAADGNYADLRLIILKSICEVLEEQHESNQA